MDLRAKARRLALQRGIKLIMIDYMQLMEGTSGIESRQQQITEISRGIKGIGPRAERPGDLPQPAQPLQRKPRRPPPADERPPRVGLH